MTRESLTGQSSANHVIRPTDVPFATSVEVIANETMLLKLRELKKYNPVAFYRLKNLISDPNTTIEYPYAGNLVCNGFMNPSGSIPSLVRVLILSQEF